MRQDCTLSRESILNPCKNGFLCHATIALSILQETVLPLVKIVHWVDRYGHSSCCCLFLAPLSCGELIFSLNGGSIS